VRTLFKITKLNITAIILLFSCANNIVLAQQDEKAAQKTTDAKSADTKSTKPKIPLPTSLVKQHKDDLKHYLPVNTVKPLLAGPDDYLTLITENTSVNNKGTMILLPDWQQGATNPKAINFLRNKLPQQGWTTITIQPANKPAGYPSKALKTLDQQKENKVLIDKYKIKFSAMINAVITKANEYPGIVVVIAQGNHGAILIDLFDEELDKELDEENSNQASNTTNNMIHSMPNAVILLSSYLLTSNELINDANTDFAKKIAYSEYPILDLYLRYDHPIVLNKTKQRLALSKQEMKVYYRQRQLSNSEMSYYPEQELITQINSWLKSVGW